MGKLVRLRIEQFRSITFEKGLRKKPWGIFFLFLTEADGLENWETQVLLHLVSILSFGTVMFKNEKKSFPKIFVQYVGLKTTVVLQLFLSDYLANIFPDIFCFWMLQSLYDDDDDDDIRGASRYSQYNPWHGGQVCEVLMF